ncbi:GMC oxidoreductase [Phanerochaete sordida]|uniref:GMC oxidoreductase n=1 Tax=Phanerochaete sordida TaxID=48140 RepID=A0A9P3GJC0_9APHY|nr:GMC oxidoreductase [Phanerochaete sordida]
MDTLARLLASPRVHRALDSPAAPTSAAVGALCIVLAWYARKQRAAPEGTPGLVTDPTQVARKIGEYAYDEFDVIVVGGGTAGCVIASRLSEDPSIRVLLLEAGQSALDLPAARIPCGYSAFWMGEHEWGMWTEPQEHGGGRRIYWPRAKLLGGCTNMNAMMFHFGAPSDYDEWAQLQKGQTGAAGWAFKEFHPYFRKFEKFNPSKEFPDVDVTLRGAEGLVKTGYHGHFAECSKAFVEASQNAGIAHSHDVNTHKGTLGVTKIMTYIDPKGRRSTAETAYLTPEVLARPNLKVVTNARAQRILFDTSSSTPVATGVEFKDKSGDTFVVKALKEVVLSAGAVHSPHILMLSGVGPADHLRSLDIPVVKDLPGVGSHLTDHATLDLHYLDKSQTSLSYLRPHNLAQKLKLIKALVQYKVAGTGPLTCNVGEAAAFVRSHDPDLFPPNQFPPETLPEDVTTGPGAPDIELFVTPMSYFEHGLKGPACPGEYTFALHSVLLRPKSHGTIRLRSKNPADAPLIDPRYLSDAGGNDVRVLMRSVRLLDRIAHTPPLADMVDAAGDGHADLHHTLGALDDAALEAWVRAHVETLYHPACTCRMAPLEDVGVVDPLLRVHGIPNLRIADASIFPEINAGHTTAPCYAIGEKAADLIKADVGSKGDVKRS